MHHWLWETTKVQISKIEKIDSNFFKFIRVNFVKLFNVFKFNLPEWIIFVVLFVVMEFVLVIVVVVQVEEVADMQL